MPSAAALFAPAIAAATVPALLAFNQPPSSTFYNQAAAAALWGLWLLVALPRAAAGRPAAALLAALALLAASAVASSGLGSLPSSLGLGPLAVLGAAALMVVAGVGTGRRLGRDTAPLDAFWFAWLVAGVLSAAIGVVQVFAPDLADGSFIARSGLVGRAVGNLRQPNHLSSLLLWSAIAVVPLRDARRLPAAAAAALMALMVFGITLSGSRTGLVGMAVLTLWGLSDLRLQRDARRLLLAVPLLFAASWGVMTVWAGQTAHTFGAALHMAAGGDISSSRFGIWRDTLGLVRMHPWAGVGWGEFNFAWSLTPFPQRPVAFFDHTHNLVLQFAVELGLPLAALVVGLLAWALWRGWQGSRRPDAAAGSGARAAFMVVLMMALHSQLEYPLWYLYFLLPTAWAWGVCLGAGAPAAADTGDPRAAPIALRAAGLALLVGGLFAVTDYRRVVVIYAPPAGAGSLAQRIADGAHAIFFGHQADYAAATTYDPSPTQLPAFRSAAHNLLDTRLMIAGARSHAAAGDVERARHIADRLREFRNPASDAFFAECDEGRTPPPFQCTPASRPMDWRDFR